MGVRVAWSILGVCLGAASVARGQGAVSANPNQVAAKVERAPLVLAPADRYRVPLVVEPLRKVAVMAPADGILRTLTTPIGSTVKEGQDLARLDAGVALARLKVAMANVKEKEADLEDARATPPSPIGQKSTTAGRVGGAEARLDAAKATAELAQMEVDACTLRAPFGGRVVGVEVSPGQYLVKGATILELADVSSVRVLLPVERAGLVVGGSIPLTIEGTATTGRVQALLPLPESQAVLRELATVLSAAWVTVPNAAGRFEPGQRARSPGLPSAPIASVPGYAIQKDAAGATSVQVIRAERVTDVAVKVLGPVGDDLTQVSGTFRPSDALIQTSSVPLRAGTFIRFSDATTSRPIEGVPPPADQVGESAEVTPGAVGVAPIGSGGRTKPAPRPASPGRPATAPSGGVVPF